MQTPWLVATPGFRDVTSNTKTPGAKKFSHKTFSPAGVIVANFERIGKF
jgi:hypothetical protein